MSFSSEIGRQAEERSGQTGTSLNGRGKTDGASGGGSNSKVNGTFLRAAWRRALKNSSGRQYAQKNGWHVLRMNLDEKSGQMTVRARQKQDGVSVSVGLSDPNLRSMVSAHTDRLEAALRAEYDTDVDFSLSADGRQSGQNGETDSQNRSPHAKHPAGLETAPEAGETGDGQRTRGRAMTGTYEWIG